MIAIVDYEVGNIKNIISCFEKLGYDPILTRDPKILLSADLVVLPGVGAYKSAMKQLEIFNLSSVLIERSNQGKYILGICLGMQLLFEASLEDGYTQGLSILKGTFKAFGTGLKVPHMGWNDLSFTKQGSLNKNLIPSPYVYYVHSYYLSDYDPDILMAYSDYGVEVPGIIHSGTIYGMQFHPEKSGPVGIQILKNLLIEIGLRKEQSLKLYPAIDIQDGKCVRLLYGKKHAVTVYNDDPVAVAKQWESLGAQRLHIVDLDGAFSGQFTNYSIIKNILSNTNLPIQVGGGIRDYQTAKKLLELGVGQIILGTAAINDLDLLNKLSQDYPNRIIVSLDAQGEYICLKGWEEATSLSIFDVIETLEKHGINTVVYTDITKDGALKGNNITLTDSLNSKTSMKIIASGGVASRDDLIALENNKISGAIIGKALYENILNLKVLRGEGYDN